MVLLAALACPPAVALGGDPDVVREIAAQLTADGLIVNGASIAGCPTTTATVRHGEQGLEVHIVDIDGRESDRVLEQPRAAVALIESWVRTVDLPSETEPATRPVETPQPPATMPVVILAPKTTRPRVLVGVATIGPGIASDGSSWIDAGAHGEMATGALRVGALVRFSVDTEKTGPMRDPSGRVDTDLLLTVGAGLRRRRLAVELAAAVGVGWMRTTRTWTAGTFHEDRGGLRASALAEVSFGHIALDLDLGVSPMAETATTQDQTGTFFPGEPAFTARVGLGWRSELP
jgi:hypothetical protein